MAVPAVQKMQNEGESGRKQINNYTRILTIIICALQAPSYLSLYVDQKQAMPADASTFWWTQTILILIAGSMFAVWLTTSKLPTTITVFVPFVNLICLIAPVVV